MTDESAEVLEALTRGRLIFPFLEEMNALRDEASAGPLLMDEKARLGELEKVFAEFEKHDKAFNAAYEAGHLELAQGHAQQALDLAQTLAVEVE